MLTEDVPPPLAGHAGAVTVADQSGPTPRHGRRTVLVVTASVLFVAFVAVTARLFVFPERGVPSHADAIVVLGGDGDRLDVAVKLAKQGIAPNLVVAVDTPYWVERNRCSRSAPIPGVTVYCFIPKPSTTQGEAEYTGRLAAQNNWRSLILVTSRPQDWRARLRMGRCFSGRVYVATATLPKRQWPLAVVYEWGATLKALFLQRSC